MPGKVNKSKCSSSIKNRKASLVTNNYKKYQNERSADAVSSRGCSREFIVKCLYYCLEYVKTLDSAPILPFDLNLIQNWLVAAKRDCMNSSHQISHYGGPLFDKNDASTYWTMPIQFYTWWKNNIERKKKFKMLKADAAYDGDNLKSKQRFKVYNSFNMFFYFPPIGLNFVQTQ